LWVFEFPVSLAFIRAVKGSHSLFLSPVICGKGCDPRTQKNVALGGLVFLQLGKNIV